MPDEQLKTEVIRTLEQMNSAVDKTRRDIGGCLTIAREFHDPMDLLSALKIASRMIEELDNQHGPSAQCGVFQELEAGQ